MSSISRSQIACAMPGYVHSRAPRVPDITRRAVAVEHEEQIAFVAEIHPAVRLQSHGVIVRLQGGTKAAAGTG
jgi:hypothetical protein